MSDARICREKGCSTVLATYNAGPKCYVHKEFTPIRGRGFVEHKLEREKHPPPDLSKDEKAAYNSGEWLG